MCSSDLWVTPPIEIRRFDAWFFLARAGEHGALRADGVEVSDAVWLTPSDALAHASHGGMRLPPPTWTTLREIERFATVDDACAWAAARPIVTRQPALVERDGTRIITLPPSADAGGTIGERRFVLRDGRWTPCE